MKTQMKFQKILSLVSLILAALSIVLAALFCSGILEKCRLFTSDSLTEDKITGEPLHDAIGADAVVAYSQKANNVFFIMALVFLLVVLTVYITATNKRRNYYVTNYVSIGLVVVYAVVFAIVLCVICGQCAHLAGQIDMAKWKGYVDLSDSDRYGNVTYVYAQSYSGSYATIVLGFILAVVILADVAAWILNTIWKIKLMKGEKELLAGNFVREVA